MQPEESELTCASKSLVTDFWEENVGKALPDQTVQLGCLKAECCNSALSWVRIRLFYLAMIGFITALICLLTAIGSLWLWSKLVRHSKSVYEHGGVVDVSVIVAMSIIFIVGIIVAVLCIPNAPENPPYMLEVEGGASDPTYIKPLLLDEDTWFDIFNQQI